MLSVVVHMWRGHDERRQFLPEHVNTFARMFRRVLTLEHEVVCVSDERDGLDKSVVRWVETPAAARALRAIPSPEGTRFPTCYQRLWNWSREARNVFAPRILAADIDTALLRDFSDELLYPDDLVGNRPTMTWGNPNRIAGGLYLLTTGSHPEVWEKFTGADSIKLARLAGFRGSDQAWISYCVGIKARLWGASAGIYSVRDFLDKNKPLPADARLIHFNGPRKPWDLQLDWVRESWR